MVTLVYISIVRISSCMQVFPTKIDQYCSLDRQLSQSEIEHHEHCIELVERLLPNHSLVTIIKNCLHSDPKERPTARQLLTTLEEMKRLAEGTIAIAKMNAARQVLAAKHFADLEYQLKVIMLAIIILLLSIDQATIICTSCRQLRGRIFGGGGG